MEKKGFRIISPKISPGRSLLHLQSHGTSSTIQPQSPPSPAEALAPPGC